MLRISLDEVIKQTQQDLSANERTVMTPGFRGEAAALREAATRFKIVFLDTVEPYIRGSLEASIGNKNGAHRYHVVLYENLKEPDVEPEPDIQSETEAEPTNVPHDQGNLTDANAEMSNLSVPSNADSVPMAD